MTPDSLRPTVMSRTAVVATENPLTATAGLRMLWQGGNAFDAAVAAGLAEGVVNPQNHTIGGEAPMLLYVAAEDRVVAINGNTVAPRAATIEWFRGRGFDLVPGEGVLAAGSPAALSAWLTVLERWGRLSFTQVVQPAIELAANGFPMYPGLRDAIIANEAKYRGPWPSSAEVYLPEGRVPRVGELFRNPDLARLLQQLATAEETAKGDRRQGIASVRRAFYAGPVAESIARFSQEQGGLLALEDLNELQTAVEEPVSVVYRDHQVFKVGPWSQGPVFLQTLQLLEGYDVAGLGLNSADFIHLVVEAQKLAFADREQYYGDPRFVEVPLPGLLSPEYAAVRRELIDPTRASLELRPGDPRGPRALLPVEPERRPDEGGLEGDTTHIDVVDAAGNMISATPSGGWIPSSPVVPGLGFPLGTRVQTFYLDPRHANALLPGKQPRTTLTPSLALRQGRPYMVFGTPGGDQQDQWTLQLFLKVVDFKLMIQSAIESPTFSSKHFPSTFYPHDAHPGWLRLEARIPDEVRLALQARGHRIELAPAWSEGNMLGIVIDPESGVRMGGADPRGWTAHRSQPYAVAE